MSMGKSLLQLGQVVTDASAFLDDRPLIPALMRFCTQSITRSLSGKTDPEKDAGPRIGR